jgi:hypothetical protein
MNAHDSARAIGRALKTNPTLAQVHVYAHDVEILDQINEAVPANGCELPAVFIKVKFQGLSGSATIGRGTVEIDVESQSDDDSSAVHSSREAAVRHIMGNFGILSTAFLEIGTVALCGRPALTDNDPGTEQRAFKTPLTYLVGVAS